jgi:hypothetical protein
LRFVSELLSLTPVGLTVTETVRALDRFYEEPLNGRIPIFSAMQMVSAEARGTDKATIEQRIRALRKATSKIDQ